MPGLSMCAEERDPSSITADGEPARDLDSHSALQEANTKAG